MTEIKKFLGVYRQPNSFDLPDGALERALNVFISDDNTISRARGFYEYYSAGLLTLSDTFLYQGKLIAAFSDRLAYFTDAGVAPNLTGTKTDLTGATFAVTAPRKTRFLEVSGSLLTTSDNGVMKLDAYNGRVYKAGAPPAGDVRGTLDYGVNGVFPGDSEVAYRTVFGRRDANDNEILGAPSDIIVLTNAAGTALAYTNPTANEVEVVVGTAHGLVAGMAVTIFDATGDTAVNGSRVVLASGLTATVFRFDKGSAVSPGTGTVSYKATRRPVVEFSVPRELTTTTESWFYQLFRSSFSATGSTSPEADWRLITEAYLTTADLAAGVIFYVDEIDPVLVQYAPELYTNPNSQEGELQANERPPRCEDMCEFQGSALFANCRFRHYLDVDVVDPSSMAAADYVELKIDSTTRRYVARAGVGNSCVTADSASFVGTTITVNYAAHGLATGNTVYVSNAKGTGTLPGGTYTITVTGAGAFTFVAAIAPTTLTRLDFQGVLEAVAGNPMFTLDTASASIASRLRNTARALVKAVNRDTAAIMTANYVSGITDTPGKMRFTATAFGGAISMRASAATPGEAFDPTLPASFAAGTQVTSRNETVVNGILWSKYQENEAAPYANLTYVGSKNKAILRVKATKDVVIVVKEDGVWKVTGDSPQTAVATPLDSTVICVAANSVAMLADQVYLLSTQGGCIVTPSGVDIVSRKIENVVEPIVGASTIATESFGIAYESHRTYRLSTLEPGGSSASIVWAHNTINDTWTEQSTLFKGGCVGPNDTLYLISTDGRILKERKNHNRLDYTAQNYASTVVSVAADKLSFVLTVAGYTPVVGDIVVKSDVITRIDSVTASGSNWAITCARATNLAAADTPTLYAGFTAIVELAPYHAGEVGKSKQFSQMQVHTRGLDIYRCTVTFTSAGFGASETFDWEVSPLELFGGWGYDGWGFFPWGMAEGIRTQTLTNPAPPLRFLVPRFASRTTWIKPRLTFREAGDELNIQAIAWTVRAYGERVSK